jgi:3-hydroxybutyryl-CoA dehydrogenase
MGSGIALVAAANAKCQVLVMDKDKSKLKDGEKYISKILSKNVEKGLLSAADKDAALGTECASGVCVFPWTFSQFD